jgi:hypothetical protein
LKTMKYLLILLWIFHFLLVPELEVYCSPETVKENVKVKKSDPEHQSSPSLTECMKFAWDVSWKRFYRSDTHLFYDYLTSYEKGRELDHLPTAEEVKRQYPNPYGYGTGMEDCMISAGVMLSLIVDRYQVTHEKFLAKKAFAVFRGIQQCATDHGIPGFLSRGICYEDLRSIYINSSRDQYTHAVYGLWCYYHSPLCKNSVKKEIGRILSSFADRMILYVKPENDYDFLRADGTRDPRGICRMWNVKGHEAARLPMIYAAAWDVTGKREYYELYRSYIKPAVEQSFLLEQRTPTYALLQMQSSFELLISLEQDSTLKKKMNEIMKMVSGMSMNRAINADNNAQKSDLTMLGSDWRTGDGLNPEKEYRKIWYCIRESGEAALTQLMYKEEKFPEKQKTLLINAITRLDYEKVSGSGIFYLQAAYWKARRLGWFVLIKE